MPSPLTCRLLLPRDLAGVERLWREETPWGSLGDTRRSWFAHNPCEGSMAVVAVDEDDRVVGELIFIAHALIVSGRPYRAMRPLASILAREWRKYLRPDPSDHPVMAMYMFGEEAARERGDGAIFILPNPKWMRFLRKFPDTLRGVFPLWSLPLPLAEPFALPAGYTASPLQGWDERVDVLWQRTASLYGCLTVRDARTLAWKTSRENYAFTAVEYRGELVGLAASVHRDVQWLICDLLSADSGESLRVTLMAACNYAHEKFFHPDSRRPFKKVAVMVTPGLKLAVESLKFQRDTYDFLFIARSLRPDIPPEELAPERWYAGAND